MFRDSASPTVYITFVWISTAMCFRIKHTLKYRHYGLFSFHLHAYFTEYHFFFLKKQNFCTMFWWLKISWRASSIKIFVCIKISVKALFFLKNIISSLSLNTEYFQSKTCNFFLVDFRYNIWFLFPLGSKS